MIQTFSVIAILALGMFGLTHLLMNNTILAFCELIGAAVALANVVLLRILKNPSLAKGILLLDVLFLLMVMLITGGTEGTGIFWFFTFPPAAFFLTGKKGGVAWMIGLYLVIVISYALSQVGLIKLSYSFIHLRQLVAAIIAMSTMVYLYEDARKNNENKLQQSQQELHDYLNNMSTFTAKLDLKGRILFANRMAQEALGMDEHSENTDFINGPWWTFAPHVHDRVRHAFAQVKSGETVNYDEKIRLANGDIINIHFSMIPIVRNNNVDYIIAEAQDITDLKKIDEQLQAKTSELERVNQLILSRHDDEANNA